MSKVLSIFICSDKGQPMISVDRANAIAGIGLEGDRYANGKGAWSVSKRVTIRQVSLISEEAITVANMQLEIPFTPEETRRNILTRGVNLNILVGREFRVGEVQLRGIELCDPCGRPSKLAGKEGFEAAFDSSGGLRAEVVSSGIVSIDDEIVFI